LPPTVQLYIFARFGAMVGCEQLETVRAEARMQRCVHGLLDDAVSKRHLVPSDRAANLRAEKPLLHRSDWRSENIEIGEMPPVTTDTRV
jgi:hypothetical protein